ncbi:uncharacterized protein BDZ99DRAFT_470042 [Mytilinidion resinicola]|uniref:Uncharacterized protein n=1 Tax=Mytilinidion resinicola TaxID=574789 RepID=A0A6A6Z791_9PEZI|nr:uncharacterized protein BDZ99DRAFT_470042 [Mytilinidion resinicola]KAF2816971.1 hypothetical protein BDZ99DRAFT_470042 [Mytilinidion resinicola]
MPAPSALNTAMSISAYDRGQLRHGPRLDIINAEGQVVMARLSANLVAHYSSTVRQHMKTVGNEKGQPKLTFELRPGSAEIQGLKQVHDWMVLSMATTPTVIKAPKNLVSAIFLARALFALGMRVDAINVDRFAEDKLRKILHPMHVKELWEQIPRDTKYVHMLVENLVRFGREDKLCKETITYIRTHNELFDRLKSPELNDSLLAKKESPQEFRARKDALEGKGKENNAARIQAQKAKAAREKAAKAAKAEAESFENDPRNHAGGAWEKELLPGQQTRSGFQYRG